MCKNLEETVQRNSDSTVTANEAAYLDLKDAFSKLWAYWPYEVILPVTPVNNRTNGKSWKDNGVAGFYTANDATMDRGNKFLQEFVKLSAECRQPFTVRSGGHGNAGQAVANGKPVLDLRGMNRIVVDLASRKVKVGAGATAGQGLYTTYTTTSRAAAKLGRASPFFPDADTVTLAGALGVGQKPSVGISGLTLGGGFGFLTRHAGLLCDQLSAVTAVLPSNGELVTATATNEYADLFWASCGGAGGNYAMITDFEYKMAPVPATGASKKVGRVKFFVKMSVEMLDFYQRWSMTMDTRITPNFEVVNNTHGMVAGIWLGTLSEWEKAVEASSACKEGANATCDPTKTLSAAGLARAIEMHVDLAQAATDLTGWTENNSTAVLVKNFREERTYFKYKSFWLLEPLPKEALALLLSDALNVGQGPNGGNYVLFEFQSMGGRAPYQDATANKFASVSPFATAFAHRHARHCLMFKSQGLTQEAGDAFMVAMEKVFTKLAPLVKGGASYVNHLDATLPGGELAYYYNGVAYNNPGVTEAEQSFWVDKLRAVRCKYNPQNTMFNGLPAGVVAGDCD